MLIDAIGFRCLRTDEEKYVVVLGSLYWKTGCGSRWRSCCDHFSWPVILLKNAMDTHISFVGRSHRHCPESFFDSWFSKGSRDIWWFYSCLEIQN